MYFCLLLTLVTKGRYRVFAIIAVFGVGAIAVLRGDVGTDTWMYELMIRDIRYMYNWYDKEPGFVVLAWGLTQITKSDEIAVRLISVLITIALLFYIKNADYDELLILLAYIIPSHFYTYSMNVLRIGVASLFILFSLQMFRRGKELKSWLILCASVFFHLSTIISILFIFAARRSWKKKIKFDCIRSIFYCSCY